jgi:hypothetical protein
MKAYLLAVFVMPASPALAQAVESRAVENIVAMLVFAAFIAVAVLVVTRPRQTAVLVAAMVIKMRRRLVRSWEAFMRQARSRADQ